MQNMNYSIQQYLTDLRVIKDNTKEWGLSSIKPFDLSFVAMPTDLKLPMGRVLDNIDRMMLSDNGDVNYAVVDLLKQIGISHKVIERDSFGPLICAIKINCGYIYYG